jgi:hypothetical protein
MSTKKQNVPIGEMATAFAGLASQGKVTLKAGDGIPSPSRLASPESTSGEVQYRPHVAYTLTAYSPSYSMGEEELTFGIAELDPAQERKASELGGKSMSAAMDEMAKLAIVRIGNKANPDYHYIERWMKEIGPKGRKLVSLAFMTENFTSDSEGESFLATKTPVRG